jgi:RNA polymerase sigma factor (sigma-70 family)
MLRRFPVVRSQNETADVVQEASLRLLNALREVGPATTRHFFALASRHIRFTLLDLARQCRRGVPSPLREHPEPVAVASGPAEAGDLLRWQALHEAAERLPAVEREVFGLRFYHGWAWPQIAELLQVNERTARRRWVSAGVALNSMLGGLVPPAAAEDEPAAQGG